ncbi:unnamed protein product [Phaedon cochleariae]|uniref:inorganic diphosphatase n=1 Tax=Phaedon cochleariae TaxID=80249 RepID=A0A9P0DM66_PHACE|nr:unnamed protein product [Phaedon cochleariae]
MNYSTTDIGLPMQNDHRIYIQDKYGLISPWHDIPLYANPSKTVFNMVVKAQRFTNANFEISLKEPLNPIKQVSQGGVPKFIPNCFPYHGFLWNYGILPQTYEFSGQSAGNTRCRGMDPIDVLEIGQRGAQTGEILTVKILGALALVDLDELQYDWQLIAIDKRDPLADCLNDICDIEKYLPGLLQATMDWFTVHKVPLGKPMNSFGPGGGLKPASFAYDIIHEVHNCWKLIVSRTIQTDEVALVNTTLEGSVFKISRSDAKEIFHNKMIQCTDDVKDIIDASFTDKVYFIDRYSGSSYGSKL